MDELAAGGVGGTTFSDWWAFKFESYDAIPTTAQPHARARCDGFPQFRFFGVGAPVVSGEAAKAVKYGGTPEEEALKFVTLNPAKQLHIDQWVGSLEPGKDGDFAIWSKSPLDSGTVFADVDWREEIFDRLLNAARVERLQKERTTSSPKQSRSRSFPKAAMRSRMTPENHSSAFRWNTNTTARSAIAWTI